MNAAARVEDSDVVAGRGDLIRGGRGREGEEGGLSGARGWVAYPRHVERAEQGRRLGEHGPMRVVDGEHERIGHGVRREGDVVLACVAP